MSTIEDLETKLTETLESVDNASKELENFVEIKNSIKTADKGLNEGVKAIQKLGESLTGNSDELKKVCSSLGEVISILKKINPEKLEKENAKITTTVAKLENEADKNFTALSQKVSEVRDSTKPIIPVILGASGAVIIILLILLNP